MLRFLLVASLAMGSVSNSLGGIPLSVSVDDDGGVASVEFEASSKFYYIPVVIGRKAVVVQILGLGVIN
jgi:hypothetical protein